MENHWKPKTTPDKTNNKDKHRKTKPINETTQKTNKNKEKQRTQHKTKQKQRTTKINKEKWHGLGIYCGVGVCWVYAVNSIPEHAALEVRV